jgi:photosystem II stability/assembly factor-like uncharacterized protein
MTDLARNWRYIASSPDGTKLAACVANGYIYTSTDSGVNWTVRMTDITRDWVTTQISGDGTVLAAANHTSGYIYTSTDSGVNWLAQMTDTTRNWYGISLTPYGQKIIASVDGGYIYTSSFTPDIGSYFNMSRSL